MIDGQVVQVVPLEFSWREVINEDGSTQVSQYKSPASNISLHFCLYI
jgi:hypothetical protein